MKKTFKKGLAVLLSATLAFCALAMPSYAAADNGLLIGDKDNTIETASEVTGSFTATINVMHTYYKFTPTQSGYYHVSGNSEDESVYFWAYDSNYYDLCYGDGSFWTNDDENGFDAYLNLEAGEMYYFEVGFYYDVLLNGSISFDVTLDYLGSITGATLVSPPDKLTYIQGYDENDYSGPDYIYYEFGFDITGALANVTFPGGQTVTLNDWAIEEVFERSYDSEKRHLGDNTVYYKLGDTVMFSFVITLIENPVESIEILHLPNKTDYTYGIDGTMRNGGFKPDFDWTGFQVKINYTNDTSKTVNWVEYTEQSSDHYIYIDGYIMYCGCYGLYNPGEVDFDINYLGQSAEFTLNITPPSFAEKLQILFEGIRQLSPNDFLIIIFFPIYLLSQQYEEPVYNIGQLFDLIKKLVNM